MSADEALRRFHECQANIVICDIALPETDGFTLVQRIRLQSSGTAAIALTGISNYQVRARACDAGFDRYFVKRVPDFILIQTVCKPAPQGREGCARPTGKSGKFVLFGRIDESHASIAVSATGPALIRSQRV